MQRYVSVIALELLITTVITGSLKRGEFLNHRIMKYINRIYRTSILDRHAALEEDGVSGYQVSYLLAVGRNDGMPQDALTNDMYVNKSTITRQLGQLEAKGFIRREPAPGDKRRLNLWLTDKGREAIVTIHASITSWTEELLGDFTEEEKDLFVRFLQTTARKSTLRVERLGLAGSRSSDRDEVKRMPEEDEVNKP